MANLALQTPFPGWFIACLSWACFSYSSAVLFDTHVLCIHAVVCPVQATSLAMTQTYTCTATMLLGSLDQLSPDAATHSPRPAVLRVQVRTGCELPTAGSMVQTGHPAAEEQADQDLFGPTTHMHPLQFTTAHLQVGHYYDTIA